MFGVGLCPAPSIMDLLPPHVEYVTGVMWATSVRDLTLGILGVEYEAGGDHSVSPAEQSLKPSLPFLGLVG